MPRSPSIDSEFHVSAFLSVTLLPFTSMFKTLDMSYSRVFFVFVFVFPTSFLSDKRKRFELAGSTPSILPAASVTFCGCMSRTLRFPGLDRP